MPANPKGSRPNPGDDPEDSTSHPEDSSGIPRKRRPYNLSPEGREHLSGLGKSRWASSAEANERESGLSDLEQRLEQTLEEPVQTRLRKAVRGEVERLPEVTRETILRVRGVDYCIHDDGRLEHLFFPSGEKTEFEEGQWFRFQDKAFQIWEGNLLRIRSTTILDRLVDRED